MSNKEVTQDWEEFVRGEVSALLDTYLPYSEKGDVGIRYKKAVIEETEGGPIYADNLITGVEILLSFDFAETMKKKD